MKIETTRQLYTEMSRLLKAQSSIAEGLVAPMAKDQATVLLGTMQATDEKLESMAASIRNDIDNHPNNFKAMAILARRLEANHPRARELVSPHFYVFLSLGIDRPGTAVLWAAFIHGYMLEYPGDPVTPEEMSFEFPNGLPTEALLQRIWEAQKRLDHKTNEPDNWLDYASAWEESNVDTAHSEG